VQKPMRQDLLIHSTPLACDDGGCSLVLSAHSAAAATCSFGCSVSATRAAVAILMRSLASTGLASLQDSIIIRALVHALLVSMNDSEVIGCHCNAAIQLILDCSEARHDRSATYSSTHLQTFSTTVVPGI
jgi:hypothetical protein